MHQTLNKTFDARESRNITQILPSLHKGFNSFQDIEFPSAKKLSLIIGSKRLKTLA